MAVELTRRELDDLRRLAARVAGEAAAYLRDNFGIEELLTTAVSHGYDSDEGMRVDVESERFIEELLRAEGFSGVLIGEEGGAVRIGEGGYVAVVDPLDGSKNYASLIPWSSVSLAIAFSAAGPPTLHDVVAGAVAPVFRWPVLSFARGLGVFEGGARAERHSVRSRVVLAYMENLEQARTLHRYLSLVGGGRGVRALGSASLEIVWASLGRAEVFVDVRGKLRTVDVAAAVGFAVEAGAKVFVEKPSARLDRVERVGTVLVSIYDDAWNMLLKAVNEGGYGEILKRGGLLG